MVIKISKNLFWIEPYIELASKCLPNLNKLKRVTAKKPRNDFTENQRVHGIISKFNNGAYSITLYTHYLSKGKIHPEVELFIDKYSTLDILCTLAHELAHMQDFDHTPEHKLLESKLITLFMKKLKKDGYESEEIEGKTNFYFRR